MGCPCMCHKSPAAKHVKACCRQCPKCNSNIQFGDFPSHISSCPGIVPPVVSKSESIVTEVITFNEKETVKIEDKVETKTETIPKIDKPIIKKVTKKKVKRKARTKKIK